MTVKLERKLLKIRSERRRRGWTQVILAYHSGVPIAEISRLECGYGTYESYVQRVADTLGLEPEELLEEVE